MGNVTGEERMMHRVLVVDDSSIARHDVVEGLRENGYDVIEAADGREGLRLFTAQAPVHLILADVHMPVMNGIEMCEELRRIVVGRLPPVLVVSTETNDDLKARGRAAGVAGWIIKPVNVTKLVTVGAALIERYLAAPQ